MHQRKTKHFIAKFLAQPFMVLQAFLKSMLVPNLPLKSIWSKERGNAHFYEALSILYDHTVLGNTTLGFEDVI